MWVVKWVVNPEDLFLIADAHFQFGVSNSTVKRMFDRLITLKLIERQGVGPGSYYNLL